MKLLSVYIALAALLDLSSLIGGGGGSNVQIRLTGSNYENILMTVGESGRTEVISTLPYILEVPKSQLPIRLKFQSENYLYYDIDVPKKPYDTTGHVYLLKVNENAMAMRSNNSNSGNNSNSFLNAGAQNSVSVPQKPISTPVQGIDITKGVNAAPLTKVKSDKTFALIIANEQYEMAANVDNAVSDGLAFKEYCIRTLGIPADNVRYASNLSFGKMRKTINDALELADMLGGDANLIMYYAGHGIPDNKTKDAFLMPIDADGTDTDVCLSLGNLYEKINSARLNQCVVFLDACFSGAQRGGDMIVAARGVKLKPKESAPQGKTIVFSATSGDQAAYSHKEEKHGLFTYYLLSKLQETKGKLNLGDLASYLTDKVGFESRRINNAAQTPTVSVSPAIADTWKDLKLTK